MASLEDQKSEIGNQTASQPAAPSPATSAPIGSAPTPMTDPTKPAVVAADPKAKKIVIKPKNLNLLPDVRLNKLRAQAQKKLATTIALTVCVICVTILLGLFVTTVAQKSAIIKNKSDIAAKKSTIANTPNVIDILTFQQNLTSLPGLYKSRTYVNQMIPILAGALPKETVVTSLGLDTAGLMTISGTTNSFALVEKTYKALVASNVLVNKSKNGSIEPDFTNVTVTSEAGSPGPAGVSFTITAQVAQGVINGSR